MRHESTVVLSDDHQKRLKALIAAKGTCLAAELLGLSRPALERAAGGLPIHRGTRALLDQQIASRDSAGKTP
jgi:hypothetical protein